MSDCYGAWAKGMSTGSEGYNDLLQENGALQAQVHELQEELRELRMANATLRMENTRLQNSVIRARYEEAEHIEEHGYEDM